MNNETNAIAFNDWALKIAEDTEQARHTITLTALSCQPPRRLAQTGLSPLWLSLVSAAARGKAVTLILPASSKTHPATAYNNGTALRAAALGIKTKLIPLPRLLHAKTVLIDEAISWIGSGNLTAAAASHNREAWLRSTEEHIAVQLLCFHENLLSH